MWERPPKDPKAIRVYGSGFPQGANHSPFLSVVLLATKGDPGFANLLMYADDGLFYSDTKFSEADVAE